MTNREREAAYWASVAGEAGAGAVVRELERSTAYRDTLPILVPTHLDLRPDAGLPHMFLHHVLDEVDGMERIADARLESRKVGATVLFELRDADRNVGLGATDGTNLAPAAVLRAFEDHRDRTIDGLHPERFGPALCM